MAGSVTPWWLTAVQKVTVVQYGIHGTQGTTGANSSSPQCTVSVLGRDEGYTVKYTPLSESEGVYLTVDSESSPNTDSI